MDTSWDEVERRFGFTRGEMKDGESVVWIGGLQPASPMSEPMEREARRWRQMMAQENIVEFDGDPTGGRLRDPSDDADA